MKRDRGHAKDGGFTMLELTTALFVVAVGLFGVVTMFHIGVGKLRALHETNLGTRVVQNELETVRSLPFSALENVENAPFKSSAPEIGGLLNARPQVTIRDADPALRLKEVTARITWTGEHGRTITKSGTTLIADKG